MNALINSLKNVADKVTSEESINIPMNVERVLDYQILKMTKSAQIIARRDN